MHQHPLSGAVDQIRKLRRLLLANTPGGPQVAELTDPPNPAEPWNAWEDAIRDSLDRLEATIVGVEDRLLLESAARECSHCAREWPLLSLIVPGFDAPQLRHRVLTKLRVLTYAKCKAEHVQRQRIAAEGRADRLKSEIEAPAEGEGNG